MKHHCHCELGEKIHRLEAKKLGILGGGLVVLHLLFHVAEALVIPAMILALRGETAATTEIAEDEEMSLTMKPHRHGQMLQKDFWQSLAEYSPLNPIQAWHFGNDVP